MKMYKVILAAAMVLAFWGCTDYEAEVEKTRDQYQAAIDEFDAAVQRAEEQGNVAEVVPKSSSSEGSKESSSSAKSSSSSSVAPSSSLAKSSSSSVASSSSSAKSSSSSIQKYTFLVQVFMPGDTLKYAVSVLSTKYPVDVYTAIKIENASLFDCLGLKSHQIEYGTEHQVLDAARTLGDQPNVTLGDTTSIKFNLNNNQALCLGATTAKFHWHGGINGSKIYTGYNSGSEWFEINDQGDSSSIGNSRIIWPVANDEDVDIADIVKRCNGICGIAELKDSLEKRDFYSTVYNHKYAQLAFMVTEDSSADVSDWGGLCITYASEHPVELHISASYAKKQQYDNPIAVLPATTGSYSIMDLSWDDFKQKNFSQTSNVTGKDVAKKMKSIQFGIFDTVQTSAVFSILEIGAKGTCIPTVERFSPITRSDFETSAYVSPSSVVYGSVKDNRTNEDYIIGKIGKYTWMLQDYDYSMGNSTGHGQIYTWNDAAENEFIGELCPDGFHLPSVEEFNDLVTSVGGSSVAGKALKAPSGWGSYKTGDGVYNGENLYGFAALPPATGTALYWSKTQDGSSAFALFIGVEDGAKIGTISKSQKASVRCVKDDNVFDPIDYTPENNLIEKYIPENDLLWYNGKIYNDVFTHTWISNDDSILVFPVNAINMSPELAAQCEGGACAFMSKPFDGVDWAAGLGLESANVISEDSIKEWDGVCVDYVSTVDSIEIRLTVKDPEGFVGNNVYRANLESTTDDKVKHACFSWLDFKQIGYFGIRKDIDEYMQKFVGVQFVLKSGSANQYFNIIAIGKNSGGSKYAYYLNSLSQCHNAMWCAPEDLNYAFVSYNNSNVYAQWYQWPIDEQQLIVTFTAQAGAQILVDLDDSQGAVAFDLNNGGSSLDISGMQGLCMQYVDSLGSSRPMLRVEYNVEDKYNYIAIELPENKDGNTIYNFSFDYFNKYNDQIEGCEKNCVLENARKISIFFDHAKGEFKMQSLGEWGTCGDGAVDYKPTDEGAEPSDD